MKVYVLTNFFSDNAPIVKLTYEDAVKAAIELAYEDKLIEDEERDNFILDLDPLAEPTSEEIFLALQSGNWGCECFCIEESELTASIPYAIQIHDTMNEDILGCVTSSNFAGSNQDLFDLVYESWKKFTDDDNDEDLGAFIEWHNADPKNEDCQLERFYLDFIQL